MTRHEQGFIAKCAEYGMTDDAARYVYTKIAEAGGFFDGVSNAASKAWDRTKGAFNKTVSSVKSDWMNNGAVPGLIGAAGGALLYNTLLKNPDDSSSAKRRKMILYGLLGSMLATGAKAHGYGNWMPEFSFNRTK